MTFEEINTPISIHALVKRATDTGKNCEIFNNYISIHALVKRATTHISSHTVTITISIHALVKRATCRCVRCSFRKNISIHALVKRATCALACNCTRNSYFNPRPRKEGDYHRLKCFHNYHHFNPRPRKEGDFCKSR